MAARAPRGQLTTNVGSLERMLRTTGLGSMPDEAPLVFLLRRLAKKLDAGGGTRDEAMYLSALKDARRVLNGAGAVPKPVGRSVAQRKADAAAAAVEEPAAPVAPATPNDLERFKLEHGIATA
jgi:hypothetical protein